MPNLWIYGYQVVYQYSERYQERGNFRQRLFVCVLPSGRNVSDIIIFIQVHAVHCDGSGLGTMDTEMDSPAPMDTSSSNTGYVISL